MWKNCFTKEINIDQIFLLKNYSMQDLILKVIFHSAIGLRLLIKSDKEKKKDFFRAYRKYLLKNEICKKKTNIILF